MCGQKSWTLNLTGRSQGWSTGILLELRHGPPSWSWEQALTGTEKKKNKTLEIHYLAMLFFSKMSDFLHCSVFMAELKVGLEN